MRAQEVSLESLTLSDGLVRAFGEIGQSILGGSNFFSSNPGPPDSPSLELWVNDTSNVPVHLNIFSVNPGPPVTWLRLAIANGVVTFQQDPAIGNPDVVPQFGADLSVFLPPNPIVEGQPGPPDFPAGLARAMNEIGQSLLGASDFFSTKPGPPTTPSLDVWLDDTVGVPVSVSVFVRGQPGPPTTWLRVTVRDGAVLVQQDPSAGKPDVQVDYSANLSAYAPPGPTEAR
jgi:hypothetical protein